MGISVRSRNGHNMVSTEGFVVKARYKLCPSCGSFFHYSAAQTRCDRCKDNLMKECLQCHEPIIYPMVKYCHVCGVMLVSDACGHYPDGH